MKGSEKVETFGERLVKVRERFGERGPKTKRQTFAKQLGIKPWSLHAWEERGFTPQGGPEELTKAFVKLAARVDPEALARWVFNGEGPMPGGAIVPNVSAPSRPGVAEERGEVTNPKTPGAGTRITARLSKKEHAAAPRDAIPAEVARPMLEAAIDGRADALEMIRALYKLITGIVVFTVITAAPRRAHAGPSCVTWDITCVTWDLTPGGRRRRLVFRLRVRVEVIRTSDSEQLLPAFTVPSSTTLTGMSQKKPYVGRTG